MMMTETDPNRFAPITPGPLADPLALSDPHWPTI